MRSRIPRKPPHEWAVGVMACGRPMPTWTDTVFSLHQCGWRPTVFADCDTANLAPIGSIETRMIYRPKFEVPLFGKKEIGPDGRFGNFQNFVQTLADLLKLHPTADVIMVVEDDAIFNVHGKAFVEERLWPDRRCGMVSLYCPDVRPFAKGQNGLWRISSVKWFAGVCLAFPRPVAQSLIDRGGWQSWVGPKVRQDREVSHPWERHGSSQWAGKNMKDLGLYGWCFSPSLVNHHSPRMSWQNNSALVFGDRINTGYRLPHRWIGAHAQPSNVYPPVRERMMIDSLQKWDEWHAGVREGSQ